MDTTRNTTTPRGVRRRLRGILVIATGMFLAISLGTGTAMAHDGRDHDGRDHRDADNTFTKWISDYPEMAGVVGGDVGAGTYAGEILALTVTDTGLVIDASYHFSGSRHAFTALVHIVQTGFTDGSTAVITGRVSAGWLSGHRVKGSYTQIACTESPDGSCFQGALDILRWSTD